MRYGVVLFARDRGITPAQAALARGTPKTFAWIAGSADGWLTTPGEADLDGKIALLHMASPQLRPRDMTSPFPSQQPGPLST